MEVSTGVTSVFLPKLTAMSARTDDMTEINGLFDRIGHIQALLVWGICAGFASIGQEFIYVWAGPEYGEAFWATLILMLGLNVSLVQNLGISVLQAKDKQGFRAIIYIVIAVLDLLVSIPVSAELGVIGCAVTAAVFLFIGTGPIMNWYYHTKIGIDIPKFWHEVIPVLIPAVLTASATLGFSALTRLGPSYGSILIKCLFFVVVYFALCWKWFFTDYERGIIRGTFHKFSRKKA
jgi:O-antigen/teichoic acid export membrane protein